MTRGSSSGTPRLLRDASVADQLAAERAAGSVVRTPVMNTTVDAAVRRCDDEICCSAIGYNLYIPKWRANKRQWPAATQRIPASVSDRGSPGVSGVSVETVLTWSPALAEVSSLIRRRRHRHQGQPRLPPRRRRPPHRPGRSAQPAPSRRERSCRRRCARAANALHACQMSSRRISEPRSHARAK